MSTPILATKLYTPPPRAKVVLRERLVERLKAGGRLALISAPAGFGKTSLLSEWLAGCGCKAAWLSLDNGDNDPARFLAYLVAALQTVAAKVGTGVLAALESPQPPPTALLLTMLLNEISAIPDNIVLILDDYHVIDARAVDEALVFLVEHLPPQVRLIIATREDPRLPMARLRAQGQLAELRAADLRFTPAEAAEFLNQVMGLGLSAENVAALETRTEGWIAGLQLAALALQGTQGQSDAASFIQSFTGSHRFVLDYLLEEVLEHLPESLQAFLLRTSILDRFNAELCEHVIGDWELGINGSLIPNLQSPIIPQLINYLERANLFIVPLDNERRWYRYHHLFADLLRQRLRQSAAAQGGGADITRLHIRASQWYEDNELDFEAFHHAAAANDIERAERLIAGRGIPLHMRGAMTVILDWLDSLPAEALEARPSLSFRHAAMLLVTGQSAGVEEKLNAAESGLQRAISAGNIPDEMARGMFGNIAAARATLALTRYQPEVMLTQARRALEFLEPGALTMRTTAYWALGNAYMWLGERAEARQAFTDAISTSQKTGHVFSIILATGGLAMIQEIENELPQAAETYRLCLDLCGDQPLPNTSEMHIGLAHIFYEWNNLDAAEQHGQLGLQLAYQYDKVIDRYVICKVFLARLKLAQGDVDGASAILAEAGESARQHNFIFRIPEVAEAQVLVLLRQGNLAAAAQLAQAHELPASRARVSLAQGNPSAALAVLEPLHEKLRAKRLVDELLKVTVLLAIALDANGEPDRAVQALGEALALAEPGGFIRTFVDEGAAMARLLGSAAGRGLAPEYIARLLAAFEGEKENNPSRQPISLARPSTELLSERELEVLRLIARGLSNQAIGERLFLSLNTVKGHTRRIFDKLDVERRTEAVARAREMGLL